MPGGSKKGGGLTTKKSTFYKMKGFSGFGNDSPISQKESDWSRRIRERKEAHKTGRGDLTKKKLETGITNISGTIHGVEKSGEPLSLPVVDLSKSKSKGKTKKKKSLKGDIKTAISTIQSDIHKVSGRVSKGFKGTDTEKVVKRVRKTKLAGDIRGAISQVKSDLSKLFKPKKKKISDLEAKYRKPGYKKFKI